MMSMTTLMCLVVVSLLLSLSTLSIASHVTVLNNENYNELTDGKAVFIRFFAPWCAHSKRLVPHWEKLAEDYKDNEIGLIAEVDCTTDGGRLCDKQRIYEFPTLKYGDPTSLMEEYEGGRNYEDLASFAKEHLKPLCSVSNPDKCTPEKKELLDQLMSMSDNELEMAIQTARNELKEAEDIFKAKAEDLQDVYRRLVTERDEKVAEINAAGLELIQSVRAHKKRTLSA